MLATDPDSTILSAFWTSYDDSWFAEVDDTIIAANANLTLFILFIIIINYIN